MRIRQTFPNITPRLTEQKDEIEETAPSIHILPMDE
jgi:hypothetical protein